MQTYLNFHKIWYSDELSFLYHKGSKWMIIITHIRHQNFTTILWNDVELPTVKSWKFMVIIQRDLSKSSFYLKRKNNVKLLVNTPGKISLHYLNNVVYQLVEYFPLRETLLKDPKDFIIILFYLVLRKREFLYNNPFLIPVNIKSCFSCIHRDQHPR